MAAQPNMPVLGQSLTTIAKEIALIPNLPVFNIQKQFH